MHNLLYLEEYQERKDISRCNALLAYTVLHCMLYITHLSMHYSSLRCIVSFVLLLLSLLLSLSLSLSLSVSLPLSLSLSLPLPLPLSP